MTPELENQLLMGTILNVAVWVLAVVVALLLAYMVIRLAIMHGMLSYSRQLDDDRGQRRYAPE